MLVRMITRPCNLRRDEVRLSPGSIVVHLPYGRRKFFEPENSGRNGFRAMLEPERSAAVVETLNLLGHSRGGQNWASGVEYAATIRRLEDYAVEIGAIKPPLI